MSNTSEKICRGIRTKILFGKDQEERKKLTAELRKICKHQRVYEIPTMIPIKIEDGFRKKSRRPRRKRMCTICEVIEPADETGKFTVLGESQVIKYLSIEKISRTRKLPI